MEATNEHKIPIDKGLAMRPHLFEPFRHTVAAAANFFSRRAFAVNTENAHEINLELPGIITEDIDVSISDHAPTIKGERKYTHEEKAKTYYFSERSYSAFQLFFLLPGDVDNRSGRRRFQ